MLFNIKNKLVVNTDDISYIDIDKKEIVLNQNVLSGEFRYGFKSLPIRLDISFLNDQQLELLSQAISKYSI